MESYLKKRGYSHPILVQLKKTQNGILVNQKWAYVKTVLNPDDKLEIHLEETASSEHIVPVELPFSIVYEDEDILVVNKPADMPIHPSINNYENTLANAVAYYYKKQGETFIFRCINRLDRDTTGLLIIAKHALSASILSKQMKARESAGLILQSAKVSFRPKSALSMLPLPERQILRLNAVLIFPMEKAQ